MKKINPRLVRLARLVILVILAAPTTMTAQNKLFTLEDLNFGGTNYGNMQPKNLFLTWWGDQLIQTDVEECFTIDAKTDPQTIFKQIQEKISELL